MVGSGHGRFGQAARVTERLRTADEVAVPVSWVRESTRSGAMPAVRLGRHWRYDRAAVLVWLESCKQPGRVVTLRTLR